MSHPTQNKCLHTNDHSSILPNLQHRNTNRIIYTNIKLTICLWFWCREATTFQTTAQMSPYQKFNKSSKFKFDPRPIYISNAKMLWQEPENQISTPATERATSHLNWKPLQYDESHQCTPLIIFLSISWHSTKQKQTQKFQTLWLCKLEQKLQQPNLGQIKDFNELFRKLHKHVNELSILERAQECNLRSGWLLSTNQFPHQEEDPKTESQERQSR